MANTTRFAYLAVALLCAAQSFAGGHSKVMVGDPAPSLLGRDIEGTEVRLESYRGRAVVVAFFANWCAPCREEMPMLEKLQRGAAARGLQVIAVDWRESRDIFRAALKSNPGWQLKFTVDPTGLAGKHYGVRGIPHTFLIGKDGTVLYTRVGYWDDELDVLLPEVIKALDAEYSPAIEVSSTVPQVTSP